MTDSVHLYGVKQHLVPTKALENLGFLLAGRGGWALENRTQPSTLSMGAGLILRTPGIVVSEAFLAFAASDCNGWARLCVLAQGCDYALLLSLQRPGDLAKLSPA